MQTLINSDALTVNLHFRWDCSKTEKVHKKRINSSKVKLFNKKKMLLSVTVKLLLKIKIFNYLIITCELSSLKYDLILKKNWLRHYNSNIN